MQWTAGQCLWSRTGCLQGLYTLCALAQIHNLPSRNTILSKIQQLYETEKGAKKDALQRMYMYNKILKYLEMLLRANIDICS